MSMDKTSRIGEVWDIGGDDVVHWKVTSRYRVEEWNVECVKPGHGVSVGDEGVIVESWLSKKGARQVRAVPAPAPASGVEVGSWWRTTVGGYICDHLHVTRVLGVHVSGVAYYNGGALSEPDGGWLLDVEKLRRDFVPIPAPPWAKQEEAKVVTAPRPAEYVSCDHCHTTGPTAERILDRAGTRRRLCDPCYVARERVTFPAGAPVEGPRQTTWAPGTGPGSVVRPWAGTVAVPGWDKRGRR